MNTKIICGKTIAESLKNEVAKKVKKLKELSIHPHLAVILVGNNTASKIYVKNKQSACAEVGIKSTTLTLPASITPIELTEKINDLNKDESVHGILLQLPLPKHLNSINFLKLINPLKDVDGLHPENLGLLFSNYPRLIPCTPQGCLQLIESVEHDLTGKNVVIIGRSVLVGKSLAILLLNKNATVTLAHSHTKDLPKICKQADILITAVGQPKLINHNFVKEGAIVIDVGINRQPNGTICGDVDFASVEPLANFITPVPGGVGPMTIANLLINLVKAVNLLEFEKNRV